MVRPTIKKKGQGQSYKLTLDGLTKGEVLALVNALNERTQVSPVAEDILGYVRRAITDSNEPTLADILTT